jgi:hypothetical protein
MIFRRQKPFGGQLPGDLRCDEVRKEKGARWVP